MKKQELPETLLNPEEVKKLAYNARTIYKLLNENQSDSLTSHASEKASLVLKN